MSVLARVHLSAQGQSFEWELDSDLTWKGTPKQYMPVVATFMSANGFSPSEGDPTYVAIDILETTMKRLGFRVLSEFVAPVADFSDKSEVVY